MTGLYKHLNFWRSKIELAIFVVIFVATSVVAAQAQTPPYALLQNSTLTGSGNVVNVTQLPVVKADGTIVYWNVVVQFDVAADGTLTVAAGYPQVTPAPQPTISNFLAGSYAGPSTDVNFLLTVSGPGVTVGGSTEWSLAAASGAAECQYPTTATWYVGPIKTSPLAARLKKAKITSTAWSYGVGSSICGPGSNWGTNSLLGFSQTNGAVTIVSFTHNSVASPEPVDQITYQKQ
jgi:hypothetical protein